MGERGARTALPLAAAECPRGHNCVPHFSRGPSPQVHTQKRLLGDSQGLWVLPRSLEGLGLDQILGVSGVVGLAKAQSVVNGGGGIRSQRGWQKKEGPRQWARVGHWICGLKEARGIWRRLGGGGSLSHLERRMTVTSSLIWK